ncbi:hypothetical protein ACN47E_002440 [Coniothyrium glycines]
MKIFLTGATGYIGGEVLHTLAHAFPGNTQISALVRDQTKAQQVQEKYPKVQTILGDLDNATLVTSEAEGSDIVLHLAATGHVPSIEAIAQGLYNRYEKTKSPGYWVQISGATCFASEEIASGKFGFPTDVTYDDVKDQSRILSTLRNNSQRVVENTVLAQDSSKVKTALLIGPLIYGPGRGPVNQRSVQAPEIARVTLNLGHGFKLNDGENIWSNVHVQDLSAFVSILVAAASNGKDGIWNDDGVYNIENGELTFKNLSELITNEALSQGHAKNNKLTTIDASEADALSSHASILWGTNARTRASKARQALGWKPSAQSLAGTIPELVRAEAKNLKEGSERAEL